MKTRLLFFAAVAMAILAAFIFLDASRWLRAALTWVESFGASGPVAFIALYVASAILMIPGSILTLSAGALFGVLRGSLLVSAAATLGAAAAFLSGRHFVREWAERKMEKHPALGRIADAVAADGWKLVLLTRLSPVFPYTLLNYAFGLTRVKFSTYIVASWVAMWPGIVTYVWVGSLARTGITRDDRTPAQWVLYGIGLAATVVATVFITRSARAAIEKRSRHPATPRDFAQEPQVGHSSTTRKK